MSDARLVVLDASVGVKWFKPGEAGAQDALSILQEHGERKVRIVVASHFVMEMVGTAVRYHGPIYGGRVWALLRDADLTVIGLDDALAEAALEQCRLLGCSFYDALAPALATVLGATLYSADARAHARHPGVALLG